MQNNSLYTSIFTLETNSSEIDDLEDNIKLEHTSIQALKNIKKELMQLKKIIRQETETKLEIIKNTTISQQDRVPEIQEKMIKFFGPIDNTNPEIKYELPYLFKKSVKNAYNLQEESEKDLIRSVDVTIRQVECDIQNTNATLNQEQKHEGIAELLESNKENIISLQKYIEHANNRKEKVLEGNRKTFQELIDNICVEIEEEFAETKAKLIERQQFSRPSLTRALALKERDLTQLFGSTVESLQLLQVAMNIIWHFNQTMVFSSN